MTTNTIQRIWNDKVPLYIVISHIFSGLAKILLDGKDSTWYTRDDDLNPETYALKVKKIKKIIYLFSSSLKCRTELMKRPAANI